MKRRDRKVITACMLLVGLQTAASAADPLPFHATRAAIRVLETDSISLHGSQTTKFFRFDAAGNGDSLECHNMTSYMLTKNSSGEAGVVTVGQCEKNASINENFVAEQTRNYRAALAAATAAQAIPEGYAATMEKAMQSKTVREQGATVIQLTQLFLPGVGGAGGHGLGLVDTVILLPEKGTKAVVVQGILRDRECEDVADASKPIACKAPATLLEAARKVSHALAGPLPELPFQLKPISPGGRTKCDSVAFLVALALLEGDERGLAVPETRLYRRYAGQPEYQMPMRLAGERHAAGMSITQAAMEVGGQCHQKSLDKP